MEKKYILISLIFALGLTAFLMFLLQSSPQSENCIQVITPAKNSTTGEVRDFPTPCDVPVGWEVIPPVVEEEQTPVISPEVSLRVGETKQNGEVSISLIDVSDSRCPNDVTCVWAGEVKATVLFSVGDKSERKTFTLLGTEETLLGYVVRFIKVSPGAGRAGVSVDKKEYLATFVISKKEVLP